MSANLVEAIIPIVAGTLVAWMQSGLIYGLLRLAEWKWPLFSYVVLVPVAIVLFYLVVGLDAPIGAVMVGVLVVTLIAMLGGWFHRRSGGASRHWFGAAALVFEATLISLAITFSVFISYMMPAGPPTRVWIPLEAIQAYSFGCNYYPALVPLAIWILKSLRLRPGIDVHSQP